MLHELRIYYCAPGRRADVMRRFETVTLAFWQKYGIRQIGFWTVLVGENSEALYYMLEWSDMGERERVWSAFVADPDRRQAMAETEKNGPLVNHFSNTFLSPTDFSQGR